eukprot:scaffold14896_cov111-Isochrysis_galbana.AAC.6
MLKRFLCCVAACCVLRARKVGVLSSCKKRKTCNHGQREGTGSLNRSRLGLRAGCLGWLRACFEAVLKAHPSVCGWLIVDWVSCGRESLLGLKRAGTAAPV